MYKCLIYGIGDMFYNCFNQVEYEVQRRNIEIVGYVSKDRKATSFGVKGGKSKLIDIEEALANIQWDYCIVFSEDFIKEKMELQKIRIAEDKIINGKVFKIIGFDFEKYIEIKADNLTIISNDCWGGNMYNLLGMRFNSPFINCIVEINEYLTMLEDLKYYINSELKMERDGDIYKCQAPIGYLGEGDRKIHIRFNHHIKFEQAKKDWDRRKARVNFNNIFVKININDGDSTKMEKFKSLQLANKVAFVPKDFHIYTSRLYNGNLKGGIESFPAYIRDMYSLQKEIDILSMLLGEKDYFREC